MLALESEMVENPAPSLLIMLAGDRSATINHGQDTPGMSEPRNLVGFGLNTKGDFVSLCSTLECGWGHSIGNVEVPVSNHLSTADTAYTLP